jgi:serine/threonine protein kinase
VTWLSDAAVARLQQVAELPDFSATRYELLDLLGRGGMGTVYRALDRELGREVAIKVVSPYVAPEAAARLLQEARILARLEHPGIVPVHDVGALPDGRLFYVMKLVRGAPLDAAVDGGLPLGERLRMFVRVCEAVGFAHAHGVVHRDLKPSNVMVGAYGEVLVLDWGVARLLPEPDVAARDGGGDRGASNTFGTDSDGRLSPGVPSSLAEAGTRLVETACGTVIGTPGFMAPEQERGTANLADARADVYALGRLLEWLVAPEGERAPAALLAVAGRARASDPDARYPSARDLAEDVARYIAGLAVRAHSETLPQRLRRVAARYRTPILLVLAYLVMRAVLLLVWR